MSGLFDPALLPAAALIVAVIGWAVLSALLERSRKRRTRIASQESGKE